jgi:hypothetical protein
MYRHDRASEPIPAPFYRSIGRGRPRALSKAADGGI